MISDTTRRRSRWMMRALEWDDPRARYPNVWHDGMPRHVLAFETVASRLRLGDLVAVYYPASQRHPERSDRFLGISRVAGLRRAEDRAYAWIDLETAHKFRRPLDVAETPRRVFLCCDPGWPQRDVGLFEKVFAAARTEGWVPSDEEISLPSMPDHRTPEPAAEPGETAAHDAAQPEPVPEPAPGERPSPRSATGRVFGGADFSGDMRDPRDKTWLALVELLDGRLRLASLEPTGRHGLQARLRDPDALLFHAEAIGLDFPFGLPLAFAEALLEGPFPADGWWALARKLEKMSRPDYLTRLQEFRDTHGEPKRRTDEVAGGFSPLHRINPDMGPMTFHGIRMMAEERSRYAIRPFETARGRLLLEVYPGAAARRLGLGSGPDGGARTQAMIQALTRLGTLPVDVGEEHLPRILASRDALDAILAARCAASAVLAGETEKPPQTLAPGHEREIHLEGWIYGLDG